MNCGLSEISHQRRTMMALNCWSAYLVYLAGFRGRASLREVVVLEAPLRLRCVLKSVVRPLIDPFSYIVHVGS
jgi:hypothetical protein